MMNNKPFFKDYFGASHLVLLVLYTFFSIILIFESLLLSWEKWALILIVFGVALCWTIHIRQQTSVNVRIWIYAVLIMITAFFYGTHITSTFDFGLVMSGVVLVFLSTGMVEIITLCQVTYYLAFIYDVYHMFISGEEFNGLVVSRILLHFFVVTIFCYVAREIIRKWSRIMEESEKEKEELENSAERLNDFLTNISHEFRTPVNAVIGLSGVCIEKEKDEQIKSDMTAVYKAGKRVGEQIGDILDYSEIDMDSLAVNDDEYMLSSMLFDIVSELKPNMPKELELVIDVDPSIPSVMSSDSVKIKKIIKHLIDNGLKFTRSGGVYVHIFPEEREYGLNLCIEVVDTGVGMSIEELEMVFDSFYQADSGRTRSTSGLGLGLSIVNGFTRKLKGFVTFDSTVNEGTMVRVSIPQRIVDHSGCMSLKDPNKLKIGAYLHFDKYPHPKVRDFYNSMIRDLVLGLQATMHRADSLEGFKKLQDRMQFTHIFVGKEEYEQEPRYFDELSKRTLIAVVAEEAFEPSKGSNVRIIRKPFYCFPVISFLDSDSYTESEGRLYTNGVRALVVDDEPMNHTVANGVFKRYGMEVFNAMSGSEAIDFIRNNDVDIIFMDHMMPGMDGVEAMKRIRTEFGRGRSDVPIVALTANAVSTAKEMFIREGFDGFVAKPIELNELERVLKRVLPRSMYTINVDDGVIDPEEREEKASTNTDNVAEKVEPVDDPYKELKELGIDVEIGIKYCQNDDGFYKQLLRQYATEADVKLKSVEEHLADNDYSNYEIIVHAIKSTSKMIGAMHLSEEAKKLEDAAKAEDRASIDSAHEASMKEYSELAKGILAFLNKGGEQ